MSGRIPQHFIDELIARTDVAEVIGTRMRLQKAGREFKGLCPFHEEKTPSFTVSPTKQFYHCFGCGAHGTAVSFLMEFEGLGFVEALEELASLAGMEIPREAGDAPPRTSATLYGILEEAAAYYAGELKNYPVAVDYLKKRGLSGPTAAEFGIGFAPEGWTTLADRFGKDPERRRALLETGMIKPRRSGDGNFDMFRERVMFPIRDPRGRVIAFGGRSLGDEEPKYMNSPESPVFHKGRELYGLHEARKALRDISTLIVVEGYMDVIGLAEHGIRNTVATLGTACTEGHLDRLFRLCEQVVFCFDGDRAGRRAAWRALENSLPGLRDGRQIEFLFLPDGHDPDTLVRAEGADAFRARMADAVPLSEFLISHVGADTDLGNVDGRAHFVEGCRPLLERIPDGVYREMLVGRIGEVARMPGSRLSALLGMRPTRMARPRRPGRAATVPGRGNMVRQAITLLLHYPQIRKEVDAPPALATVERPGIPVLLSLLEVLAAEPELSTAAVLERWRDDPHGQHLAKLATLEVLVAEEAAVEELRHILLQLAERAERERRTGELMLKAGESALNEAEKQELQRLLRDQNSSGSADGGPA